MLNRLMKFFLVLGLVVSFGAAMAQPEPTLNQVYEAAQAGRLSQAQDMMKQVLRDHPQSGKAHYVEAELLARQKMYAQAREELATAESLAPGLTFAKPSAVRALREELAAASAPAQRQSGYSQLSGVNRPVGSSIPWGLLLGVGAIAAVLFVVMSRRRSAASSMGPGGYSTGATYGQPGVGNSPVYGQPGYGQPGYGQPGQPAPGMGSNLMGGLATGLAAGAGMVAAEQIGRRLFGSEHTQGLPVQGDNQMIALDPNDRMGGDNFGVNDAGSWDDGGGSVDLGGDLGGADLGGGWDS
jgi:hypothetical protein